jgi:transglutaminase-like putative cysteine protease
LYWRARVYDHYENGKWTASEQETGSFSPRNENISIPDTKLRQEYDFAITAYTHRQAVLYLPAQPLWVSRPVDVRSYELPDGQQDVVVLEAFPFLESGETYHARSAIANPSVQDLRAAGQDYPDWVKRYLQLPENFSNRIAGFTTQITFGLETPYDKAEAITTVLRAQIKYNPSLILPPEGTDLMEWFLFEGREGYCNYYATAEVLMLRSVGIPARLAVGFAQGDANKNELEFLVYRKHAHAWPEVYFPGYGWIEFEPTGNQTPLERRIESETGQADDGGLEAGDSPEANPAVDQPSGGQFCLRLGSSCWRARPSSS